MKIQLIPLSLILLASFTSSASAVDMQTSTGRTPLNKVKIINNSGKNMGYVIISASDNPDYLYGIKAKNTDSYHAKATGDVNATVKIVPCKKINKISGMCTEFDSDHVRNCVSQARYDFYKVKAVKITSQDSCSVICNDGTNCEVS